MADAPEIKVKLTAEDAGVAAAIKELGAQLKTLKTREEETAGSSIRLADAFKGLVAAIAVDRLVEFGKEVFETGVNIARMTQITGASASTLSAAYYKASEELGIGTDVVDKAFIRLSKSIIEFQQGSSIATKAFGQLRISTKDFIGLNTDQKIRLVTDRLGGMAAGTERAGLSQLILSRGGAVALPVLQALAGEGFAEATKEAKKFGLYLDNEGANALLHMKNELGDLEGEAKGAALQFELGLVPALANVVGGIADAISGSGAANGFKQLGEEVGTLVEQVTYGLVTDGQKAAEIIAEIETTWDFALDHIKNATKGAFEAIGGEIKGELEGDLQAIKDLAQGKKVEVSLFGGGAAGAKKAFEASSNDAKEYAAQIAAIQKQFKDANAKSDIDIFGGAAGTVHRPKGKQPGDETSDPAAQAALRAEASADSLAKAKASREEASNAGLRSIDEAGYKQQEQDLRDHYDRGLISTEDYFRARAELARAETASTVEELQKQITEQQALAERFAKESVANRAKAGRPGQTDQLRSEFAQAAARDAEEQTAALQKVDELQKKIQVAAIDGETRVKALETDRFKATEEGENKVLAFQKEIAALQGKGQETTKAEIAEQVEKQRIALEQAGQSKTQVAAEIAQFAQLKNAQADYQDAKQKTEQDTKAFEIQKQAIQIQAKAGRLTPLEEEQQINQLIKDRLPLLKADAAAELSAARKTGNDDYIAGAQNSVQQTDNLSVATNKLGSQVRDALTSDFTTFFETVGRGTQSVARQFENLAASVVQSIEKIVEKMLIQIVTQKILNSLSAGSGAGGGVSSGLGVAKLFGFAGGGLIKGPGGPKSDSIPARLSAGEFVVKADAVTRFGAHNLETINRGLKVPSFANLALPKYAEGGLVGSPGAPGASGRVSVDLTLDRGLILQHLDTKEAGRIVLNHIANNPKAASKALGRSQG